MKLALLFIFHFFISYASPESACSQLSNDCEYYLCIHHEKSCPDKAYPKSFGYKYCMKYGRKLDHFSNQGQLWVDEVRQCLIREMEDFENGITCRELGKKAFRSHVPCYAKSGFCELSLNDKNKVLQVITPALFKTAAISDTLKLLRSCSR